MMRAWPVLLVLVAQGCGCGAPPGFKRVGDGVFLRHHVLGDGAATATDSDSVHLHLRAARNGGDPGSYYSTLRGYAARDLRTGALMPALRRLREGDSITLIAPWRSVPWPVLAPHGIEPLPDTATMRLEIALIDLRTPGEMRQAAADHRRHDPDGYGRKLIAAWMARDTTGWRRWGTSDLHFRVIGTPTDTHRVALDETVALDYTGHRLEDGRVFDSSARNGQPFVLRWGTPDQVIEGLEVAVHLLREGQEGEFLIPAAMAFGERGIEGALDPGSPVMYRVRFTRVPQP